VLKCADGLSRLPGVKRNLQANVLQQAVIIIIIIIVTHWHSGLA